MQNRSIIFMAIVDKKKKKNTGKQAKTCFSTKQLRRKHVAKKQLKPQLQHHQLDTLYACTEYETGEHLSGSDNDVEFETFRVKQKTKLENKTNKIPRQL